MQWVVNAVDSQLFAAMGEQYGSLKTQLWSTADEEISLADCHIYRLVCILKWVIEWKGL